MTEMLCFYMVMGDVCDGMDLCSPNVMGQFLSSISWETFFNLVCARPHLALTSESQLQFFCVKTK